MKANLKLLRTLLFLTLFTSVPMVYNSCSSEHSAGEDSSATSLKACDLTNYYTRTWYPFLQRQCASCHVQGGEGNGIFADKNLADAFKAFQLKGFSGIGKYAVDPGHKPPYTGLHNKVEVDGLMNRWAEAEIEAEKLCGESILSDGRVTEDFSTWMRTVSKPINAAQVGDKFDIEWSLDDDLLPENISDTYSISSGAKVKVTVEVRENIGEVYYAIYDPMLDMAGATTDLKLLGLAFRLNGIIIDNQTTFYKIDVTRYRNDRDNAAPISFGAMIAQGTRRTSDILSLQIKSLENLDLGPQPDGATVNIATSDLAINESGTHTFTLNLSEAILTREVSVGINDTENNKAVGYTNLQTIDDADGDSIQVMRHDWDYRVIDRIVTFSPGETTASFRVYINPDDRYEVTAEEKFRLSIDFVNGPAEAGTNTELDVSITDTDPMPGLDEVTYSDLLSPGGVFRVHCINCHNSVSNIGGYDITNYNLMKTADVVHEGDYLTSQMYIRVNGGTPTFAKMPKDRDISFYQIDQIMKWIGGDGGAGNAKND